MDISAGGGEQIKRVETLLHEKQLTSELQSELKTTDVREKVCKGHDRVKDKHF